MGKGGERETREMKRERRETRERERYMCTE
jgi:hypothetical protein